MVKQIVVDLQDRSGPVRCARHSLATLHAMYVCIYDTMHCVCSRRACLMPHGQHLLALLQRPAAPLLHTHCMLWSGTP
jgi:hypothetical protein